MAVTNNQEFKIKITVDADQFASGLGDASAASKNITVDTKQLESQMATLTASLQTATATLEKVSVSYNKAATSSEAMVTAVKNSSASIQSLNANYAVLQHNTSTVNVAMAAGQPLLTKNNKGFHDIGSTVAQASRDVSLAIATFSHLMQILQILTNPANVQRAVNLMQVFALMARVRGHDELSANLLGAAHNLLQIEGTIQQVKQKSEEAFPAIAGKIKLVTEASEELKKNSADGFQGLAEKATFAQKALSIFDAAFKIGGAALFTASLGALATRFPALASVIAPVTEHVGAFFKSMSIFNDLTGKVSSIKTFSAGLTEMGGTVKKTGEYLTQLGTNSDTTLGTVKLASSTFIGMGNVLEKVSGSVNKFSSTLDYVAGSVAKVESLSVFDKRIGSISQTLRTASEYVNYFAGRIDTMSSASKHFGEALLHVEENFPVFAKGVQFLGGAVEKFSAVFSGLGKDAGDAAGILKDLALTFPPLIGKIGAALGIITGISGALFGLGTVLLKTDSTMGKIAGGSMIAIALAAGGILVAVKALSAAMGNFVMGIGKDLFTLFDAGIPKATADEQALIGFSKTIINLSASVEQGRASLEGWNRTVDAVAETSKMGGSEVQEYAKSVVRMGQEFNISIAQQQKLTGAIGALAANGEEALLMTEAIRLAFLGTGKQAEEMGLHVNSLAVNHSVYAQQLGKVAGTMSRTELVQAKLALVFDQAAIATERLGANTESLASIQHKLAVSSDEIASQFATGSIPIYKILAKSQLEVLQTIQALPQWFKNGAASITAWSGAMLVAVGAAMKWSFLVAGTIGAITTLNVLVARSAATQAVLALAFSITNTAMGVQTVAITGLVSIFQNFLLLLKGSLLTAFGALASALSAVVLATLRFTAALLTNPLFLAGAAVVASIYFLSKAMQELNSELSFLRIGFDSSSSSVKQSTESLGIYARALLFLKSAAIGVYDALKSLAKIAISELLAAFVGLNIAYAKLRLSFAASTADQAKWRKEIETSRGYIKEIGISLGESGRVLSSVFENSAMAAEGTAKKVAKLNDLVAQFKSTIGLIKADPIKDAYTKTAILGTSFEKAKAEAELAHFEFNKAFSDLANQQEQTKEMIDDVANKREESVKSYLNLTKITQDTILEFSKQERQLAIDALRDKGDLMGATALENAERIRAFKEQVKGLEVLGNMTKEQKAVMISLGEEVAARNTAALSKASQEVTRLFLENKLQSARSAHDAGALLQAQHAIDLNNAKVALASRMIEEEGYNSAILAANQERDLKISELANDFSTKNKIILDKQLADLQSFFDKGLIGYEQFYKAVNVAKETANINTKTETATAEEAPQANIATQMSIGVVSPMLSGFSKIVDAIKSLIDFIPTMIQKVADIFTGIRDLPAKIAAAVINLINGITSLARNLLPNITRAAYAIIDKFVVSIGESVDAIANIFDQIPDFFIKAIQEIPKVIPKLITGLLSAIPKLMSAVIKYWVKGLPEIWKALWTMISSDLPNAIKEGFIQAASIITDIFKGIFSGNYYKPLTIDTSSLNRALDTLKGSGSQIFSVDDFKAAARSVDLSDKIRDAAESAANNIGRYLTQLWRDLEALLKKVWNWVYKEILTPIQDIVEKAFLWVWNKVLLPIVDLVAQAFSWVVEHVLTPIGTVVQKAFQWVIDHVIGPIADAVTSAFQWVIDHVITPIYNAITDAFQWVIDKVISPLANAVSGAFQWVVDHVVSPIINAFSSISSWKFPSFDWPEIHFSWPKIEKPDWFHLESGGPVSGLIGGIGGGTLGAAVTSISHMHLAQGGMVRGGRLYAEGGTSVLGTDIVPAMLTPGEFVINRHAAGRVGMPNLERLNNGQGFGGGGITVTSPITINTTQPVDSTFIRNKLLPEILDGIKRASQSGNYVIAQAGIRSV